MEFNAQKHVLQTLVAPPQGAYSRLAIASAAKEASQFGDSANEIANCEVSSLVARKAPNQLALVLGGHLAGRFMRLVVQSAAQLKYAHGHNRQDRQACFHPLGGFK